MVLKIPRGRELEDLEGEEGRSQEDGYDNTKRISTG